MAAFHAAMLPTYFVTVLLLTAYSLPCHHDAAIPEVTGDPQRFFCFWWWVLACFCIGVYTSLPWPLSWDPMQTNLSREGLAWVSTLTHLQLGGSSDFSASRKAFNSCKKGQHISCAFQNISVSVPQTSSELYNLYCSAKWGIPCSFVVWWIHISNTNLKQASNKTVLTSKSHQTLG